jgi:ankyrin repeat protein
LLMLAVAALLGLFMTQPAAAQFSDSYKFLEAVRKGDNDAILKALEQPGVTLVNTKDKITGETALLITIGRRDVAHTRYPLSRGARPELTDNQGRSPLMLAVEKRFFEGAEMLLGVSANPNQTNNSGETPLIRAVQMRDLAMVRLLMTAGADPNRRDALAGQSAIDYARQGSPVPGMVEALTAGKQAPKSKAVQGPTL